ncbi:unnamed protein product [Schistosoma mattheei]|uniref:Uncharacterized protein n=1 Tax=Schistosoma mattheei TaxID=31246 RepID=A0A183NNX1_9TREM|nr:unnamed protein product [Schistosoma mattheei]
MQNISSGVSNFSTNMKQLLAKSGEREHPRKFECGLSGQQFPLSFEEKLGTLDAFLQQEDIRDRFISQQNKFDHLCLLLRMGIMTRLTGDNSKTSMRYILSYIMTPEIASHFTLLGSSSKRALQKCRF